MGLGLGLGLALRREGLLQQRREPRHARTKVERCRAQPAARAAEAAREEAEAGARLVEAWGVACSMGRYLV